MLLCLFQPLGALVQESFRSFIMKRGYRKRQRWWARRPYDNNTYYLFFCRLTLLQDYSLGGYRFRLDSGTDYYNIILQSPTSTLFLTPKPNVSHEPF